MKKEASEYYLFIINTEKELYACIQCSSLGYKTVDYEQYENISSISNFVPINDMNTVLHSIHTELIEEGIKISYKLLIEQIEKSGIIKNIGYNEMYETLKAQEILDIDTISLITDYLV